MSVCVVVRTSPVHAHIVVFSIPTTYIYAKFDFRIGLVNDGRSALHEIVDNLSSPLVPLPEILRFLFRDGPVSSACRQDVIRPINALDAYVVHKHSLREVREIGLKACETTSVEENSIQILVAGQILNQAKQIFLDFRVGRVEENRTHRISPFHSLYALGSIIHSLPRLLSRVCSQETTRSERRI